MQCRRQTERYIYVGKHCMHTGWSDTHLGRAALPHIMHAAPTIRAGRSAHQVQNPTTTRLPLLAEAPPGLVVEVRHLLGVHCYLFSAEWRKLSVLSVVPTSKMTLLTTAGSRKKRVRQRYQGSCARKGMADGESLRMKTDGCAG